MSVIKIAKILCKQLVEAGFIVQRYDAYSTNSIYLKLDYGVCNSIRISDHPGKKHLKYRYNIGPFITEYKYVRDKFPRFYYRQDRIRNLIKKILEDKQEKINKYGMCNYQKFMEQNQIDNSDSEGFWRNAKIVN